MTSPESDRCPLCGGPNKCAVSAKADADCWCFTRKVPKGLIEQLPPEKRRTACICVNCVQQYESKQV